MSNLEQLKIRVDRLKGLLDAAELGLFSWRRAYGQEMKAITDFWNDEPEGAKTMSGLDGVSPYRESADPHVLDLVAQLDKARSERDLMERMYHGSLGTAENCSKLNRALADWQQQSLPAVRAVREILQQRPELRGPDGIVRAVMNGTAGQCQGSTESHPTGKGESVCVGEMIAQPDGGAFLRCSNCNVVVAQLSQVQLSVLNFPDKDGLQAHWQAEWADHTRNKFSPTQGAGAGPNESTPSSPGPAPLIDGKDGGVQAPVVPANPNAGVKQAFPNGRWT